MRQIFLARGQRFAEMRELLSSGVGMEVFRRRSRRTASSARQACPGEGGKASAWGRGRIGEQLCMRPSTPMARAGAHGAAR